MYDLAEIIVSPDTINSFYKKGTLPVDEDTNYDSYFFILKTECGQQSALGFYDTECDEIKLLKTKDLSYQGFRPRDAAQSCFFWALTHKPLVVALGAAGTGKTTVALAYALNQVFRHDKVLILCKPTCFVGMKSNAIGAIPGDHREKLEGYMDSYMIAMRKIVGETFEHHLYQLEEEGKILFKPFELLRGQHFEDAVVVIDEAQNTTPHELLTAISRVGERSTLVIMGDSLQVDTGLSHEETGLSKLITSDAFYSSDLVAAVQLTAQYRGPLAQLAADILEEFREVDSETLT